MSRIHANNYATTINGSITNVATSIVLTSVTGFPSIGAGVTCNLTLQSGSVIEIVTATALSTNTITVTRAAEGTTGVAWSDGASISIRPTADSVDRKADAADITEQAQDAVGAMVDASLTYVDATPLLQRAALTGDVTASAGSNATTIANSAITLAKMANIATSSLIYRKTSGTGAPEVNTLATVKTDLGLTGTNSGDQTITLTGGVTGSGTGSFAATVITNANLTGVVTSTGNATAIANGAITNAMLANGAVANLSGTNTGDQTITLTSDVTGTGTGSFATTIAANAVTLSKMATMATASILGRNTAGTGIPEVLSASTTKSLLSLNNVENTALSTWAGSTNVTTLGTLTAGTWNATVVTVTYGGNGRASATAYAPIVGGTTSTGAHQSMASGSTGQIMQSAGNAAVPTWTTPTYPSGSGTSRKILVSDGTNNVYSTETWAVPSTSGKLLQSDGTNWTAATPTGTGVPVLATSPTLVTPLLGTPTSGTLTSCTGLPLTTGVTGSLPIANAGTNITTYTTGDILYASATNTLSKLGVGSTGQQLEIASGIPAWKGGRTAFSATRSGTQTISAAVITKLQLSVENFDTGSYYDNATNFRYTPLIAGKYLFTLYFDANTTGASSIIGYIYQNGASVANQFSYYVGVGDLSVSVSTILAMNGSTDYVEFFGFIGAGTVVNAVSTGTGCLLETN